MLEDQGRMLSEKEHVRATQYLKLRTLDIDLNEIHSCARDQGPVERRHAYADLVYELIGIRVHPAPEATACRSAAHVVEPGLPNLIAQRTTPNLNIWEILFQIAAIGGDRLKRYVMTGWSRPHNLSQDLTAVAADIQTVRVGIKLGAYELGKPAIGVGRPDAEPCVNRAEQWLDGCIAYQV